MIRAIILNEKGEMWKMTKKPLYLKDLDVVFVTRDFASFVIEFAKRKKLDELSLRGVDSLSRSFLDELYILAKVNKMKIVDISADVLPLFEIITRSHKDQVLYAPKVGARISDETFA